MQATTISNESGTDLITEKVSSKNVYLPHILKHSPKGRLIIHHYETYHKLNDPCRVSIIELINNFLIQNEIKMSNELAKNISRQIIDEFPTEDIVIKNVKDYKLINII